MYEFAHEKLALAVDFLDVGHADRGRVRFATY